MLSFEGRGIEVENPPFARRVRFPLSTKGLLKFPTQGGSRTGLVLRVLSKDLFCCFSTSSLVLISASLSWVLGKMEHTNFAHVSLNDLHFLSCRIINGIPIKLFEPWKQSGPPVNSDIYDLVLKKHTCVWGSSGNKSPLGEERNSVREKGRWPPRDPCGLWDRPASREQFGDEEAHLPQSHVQAFAFTSLVHTLHSWPGRN